MVESKPTIQQYLAFKLDKWLEKRVETRIDEVKRLGYSSGRWNYRLDPNTARPWWSKFQWFTGRNTVKLVVLLIGWNLVFNSGFFSLAQTLLQTVVGFIPLFLAVGLLAAAVSLAFIRD